MPYRDKERRVVEGERAWFPRVRGQRDFDLGTDLLEQRGVIETDRLAPQRVALEVPDDDRTHAHRLSGCRPPQERAEMGAAPLVLCDDTPFVRAQDTANPYREVGKSFPMLSIPFSCLQRPKKRLQRADDVVEAIRCHPTDQCVDVMLTLGADMFTQNRHTLGRNRQFDLSARVLSDLCKGPSGSDCKTKAAPPNRSTWVGVIECRGASPDKRPPACPRQAIPLGGTA